MARLREIALGREGSPFLLNHVNQMKRANLFFSLILGTKIIAIFATLFLGQMQLNMFMGLLTKFLKNETISAILCGKNLINMPQ